VATSEFDLIARYFTHRARHTVLGVGDDAALVRIKRGHELVISADMLVASRHFFRDANPRQLGHKALAVNLSDLAAMGATPRWATLALALPQADARWVSEFSRGFMALARRFDVDLIGGDTTRGPLNICVQIMGEVPRGKALRRDGARAGDDLWVSGALGDAAFALAALKRRIRLKPAELRQCAARLHAPTARVNLGLALRGLAHSVECWQGEEMVGGLYGVALGGAFFGESMFSQERDASKVALAHLVARLRFGDFLLLDAQFMTEHLAQFGAEEIARADYLQRLDRALVRNADFYRMPAHAPGEAVLRAIGQDRA